MRTAIPEHIRLEVINRSNNRCCVCQTPFLQIHHLDEDPSNNAIDNLAPLCPNCHTQAHSRGKMTLNLTASRIAALRDKWYDYCDRRHDSSGISPNAMLKLKNFVRSMGLAQYSWAKSFAPIDARYKDMTREQIIDTLFATSNHDEIASYLETVKYMYDVPGKDHLVVNRFVALCNAFGIDYDELG